MSVSIVLITLNEESNIDACLASAKWADEIVVVDSGSNDRTIEKARAHTSKVLTHPFKNFAEQKNYAIRQATGDWIFVLDADERIPQELADEIRKTERLNQQAVYQVKRRTYFFENPMRYSGTQQDFPIRFFPRGKAEFSQPVHEQIETDLPIRRLEKALEHRTTANFAQYQIKLQRYIPLEIEAMKQNGKRPSLFLVIAQPVAKFLFLYIAKLGFLDGITGLQFAGLSAYYDFLKQKTFLKTE